MERIAELYSIVLRAIKPIMHVSQIERLILKDLFEAEAGLDLYTFWRRYQIEPQALSKATTRLTKINIISLSEGRLELTNAGRKRLQSDLAKLLTVGKKTWREVPAELKSTQLPVNSPYTPQFTKVDPALLPKRWRDLQQELRADGDKAN